jgi:hypothetical protein
MASFNLSIFLLGCLGGLLPDILRIIRNRYTIDVPIYLKNINFWIGIALLVAIGGLTAWVLNAETMKDALIYGYASPQILSQLAASTSSERVERGSYDQKAFELRRWWAA